MASSVDTRMGLWKRVPGFAKVFMLGEAFVITFLSAWLYEEYVSNRFMQAYVNDFFRSDAGAMAVLGVIVAVVGLIMVGLLYRTKSEVRVAKIPVETGLRSSVSAVSPVLVKGVGPDSSGPLHPMVAALKAEISSASMLMVGPTEDFKSEQPAPTSGTEAAATPSKENPVSVAAGTTPAVKKVEAENRAEDKNAS